MEILISAFILGLAGSMHCIGMCGPIVLALPLHGNTPGGKVLGGLLYNLGRTTTYGLMGFLSGLLGQGIAMIGFQQKISVIMGSLMVVAVLFPRLFKNQYSMENSSSAWGRKLKSTIARMFAIQSYNSLFLIGMLNGLLPCGLVYMAIAAAIGTGKAGLGALFMLLFGLGTLPVLLALGIAGNILSGAARKKINKLIPVLVVIVGIFFILRGLDLGIPFLSPRKDKIEHKFQEKLNKEARTKSLQLHARDFGPKE
ncbi:MAG: hypothetical protein CSA96_06035 [Bacteroidetes bacterium]|nr:MAG: hypothetical protein CSA96_06035 [Bacteroidota bacterium]